MNLVFNLLSERIPIVFLSVKIVHRAKITHRIKIVSHTQNKLVVICLDGVFSVLCVPLLLFSRIISLRWILFFPRRFTEQIVSFDVAKL